MGCSIGSVWSLVFLAASSWARVAYANPQALDEAEEQSKRLIVMVKGELAGEETIGAGIIFGVGPDRLYIATANHVVRRGTTKVKNLRVQIFKFRPGEWVNATLIEVQDEGLDLAVLSVDLNQYKIPIEMLPLNRLSAGIPRRKDKVYTIGQNWIINVMPGVIAEINRDKIYFESNSVVPGSSGGGLFNKHWKLVGMITADQPPRAEAVNFERIRAFLESIYYPTFPGIEKGRFAKRVGYSTLPGGAGLQTGSWRKALTLGLFQIAPIPFAIYFDQQQRDYLEQARNAAIVGNQPALDASFDRAQDFLLRENLMVGLSAAAYLINIVDVFIHANGPQYQVTISGNGNGFRVGIAKEF